MNIDFGLVEVLLIDLAALVTIYGFFHMKAKSQQDGQIAFQERTNDRISDLRAWASTEIAQLSSSCVRRDDIKDMINPIRHDITELRHQMHELIKSLTKNKN